MLDKQMKMWILTVFVLTCVCLCITVESDGVYNNREGTKDESSSRILYPHEFSQDYPVPEHHHHHHPPNYHSHHVSHRTFPPDFQHNPHFHANDPTVNPRQTAVTTNEDEDDDDEYGNPTSYKIPLDFIKNINEYNVSDLLINFVEGDTDDVPFIASRFGDDGARNAAVIPKAAGCEPELKAVKLATSDDPSILYIPQCTRVERCGGCCSHTLLSCQPKETETLLYQVMKTQYTGGRKLKFVGKEVIPLERHIKCKCDCKVKEENCNKYQEYRQSECRCACTNYDEEKKCDKGGSKKLWNPELCACQCRDLLQCSTGYSFDQNECRCLPAAVKRRFANYDRKGYVSQATDDSLSVERF